eukprot:CAMPEP_0179887376 /NCGR_PEP_ID=MMETSP0982-20121206/31380_1 /TAXON_ID=483367 /ORGANISM="non described non described, Strain CCMP 2436" /LENGTH=204 /DNA_ID=CAMNT_0021783217 /DNA_START=648 /DNA_END=1263 /DNA_ORIENTATION=+
MYAALGGHLTLLQYARAAGCLWDFDTCLGAARNGHLALLQWARAHGCEWDEEEICRAAVRGGHLALLQWACANGCDLGSLTCARARELMQMEPIELFMDYLDSEDSENDEAMEGFEPLGWMEAGFETEETAQRTAASGTRRQCAEQLCAGATWLCCGGRVPTDVTWLVTCASARELMQMEPIELMDDPDFVVENPMMEGLEPLG